MRYRLELYVNSRHSLYHAAKIYAGLDALARRGLITLRALAHPEGATELVLFQATALGTGSQRLIGVDLHDHSAAFCRVGLAQCDVYLKRSLYRPDALVLPAEQRGKILPFGLNYGCASDASRRWVLRHWGVGVAKTLGRWPRAGVQRLGRWLREVRHYVALHDFAYFEQPPDAVVEPAALFQTRVWPPEESSENLEEINEERVLLIRRLRQVFGSRFRGGIVPTPFARRHYPDVVLAESYRHEDYVKVMQRHLVCINTRGLHNSIAFKLPEYLAASVCIVSEPLRNELPHPLVAGEHYHEFRSHDECIARCERLLSNPAEAREMRRHSAAYYRRWVAPAEHMLDCLDRALA